MIAGAHVAGVEYAPRSFAETVRLFEHARQSADLRHEDIFDTSFGAEFDVVYSFGLVEHFFGDALRILVRKHFELLKRDGTAIIVIPDFKRFYGRVLKWINRPNYDTHNIEIMSIEALRDLAPEEAKVEVFRYGRFTPWYFSFGEPRNPLLRVLFLGLNMAGLMQPMEIDALCPMLVMILSK